MKINLRIVQCEKTHVYACSDVCNVMILGSICRERLWGAVRHV